MRLPELGDFVRVVGLPNSELQGLRGTVVEVVESTKEGQNVRPECAVLFPPKGRRWVLADHLVRSVPEKCLRFFRYEVLERWGQLSPGDVSSLHGDSDELARLLQDRYDFTSRRSRSEVDEFFSQFESRIASATASPDGGARERRAISAA